jgi:transposase
VLLRSERWPVAKIAQALRKSEASHLNTEQTQQLVAQLSDITYLHTHQIVAYIQKTWKITYSVSGLWVK